MFCGLSIDIKHIQITWTGNIQALSKFENWKFLLYFFNKDISFNIPSKRFKFSAHIDKGHLEGSVSRIIDLGPSFYFMQSWKKKF